MQTVAGKEAAHEHGHGPRALRFFGAATAARWVGQRMPRLEDQRMVTGHGQYIDDLNKPGMVHVAFVRSTVARGRIIGLDVTEARRAPGVIAVLTAADINPRAQAGPGGRGQDPAEGAGRRGRPVRR